MAVATTAPSKYPCENAHQNPWPMLSRFPVPLMVTSASAIFWSNRSEAFFHRLAESCIDCRNEIRNTKNPASCRLIISVSSSR